MPTTFSVSIKDYDTQTGRVGFNVDTPDGLTYDALDSSTQSLALAVQQMIVGLVVSTSLTTVTRWQGSFNASSDKVAQRGNKWFVRYIDASEFLDAANTVPNPSYLGTFDFSIPTANLDLRDNNENFVYTLDGTGQLQVFTDFVTEAEAIVRSPNGGTIFIQTIEAVTSRGG